MFPPSVFLNPTAPTRRRRAIILVLLVIRLVGPLRVRKNWDTGMNGGLRTGRLVGTGLFALLVIVVVVGLWKVENAPAGRLVAVQRRPERMMGTQCMLAAVVPRGELERGQAALREAETALRATEARMSSWLDDSEISQLNRAGVESPVRLSPDSVQVLRLAAEAWQETDGAFDATCRPLIELWKRAGRDNRLPTDAQIAEARKQSGWDDFHWMSTIVKKRSATASVDLGGIAKGYAIDRAAAAMRTAGLEGGLVDVGGDVACFGRPPDRPTWRVEVRSPFRMECFTTLRLSEGAVCTSGDYARYNVIQGRRYSHIVDPRLGRPAASVVSATVVAPNAVTADVWATALSVLGPQGIDRLPENLDALLIVGTVENHKIYCTPDLRPRIEQRLPAEPIIVERRASDRAGRGN